MLKLHVIYYIKAIGEMFVSSLFICNIGDGFPEPKHALTREWVRWLIQSWKKLIQKLYIRP